MSDSIIFKKENSLATVTLNRPDKLNSFNREMALNLQDVLKQIADDSEVRAVLLTGAGRAFCAGQDLAEVTGGDLNLGVIVREHYNPIIKALRKLEKPVVVAVNGVAAGAGANLAFAGDITYAGKSAKFIQSFSSIGLIPDSGGTFILPRLVGMQRASAFMMLADKIEAEKAEEIGMIYKAVADESLIEIATETANKLAQLPTRGFAFTKMLLNESAYNSLDDQLELEEKYQSLAGKTYDYNEGVAAFLEKRKPNFKGE